MLEKSGTETGFWLSFFVFLLLIIRNLRKACSNAICLSHIPHVVTWASLQENVTYAGTDICKYGWVFISVVSVSFESYVYVLASSQIYSVVTLNFRFDIMFLISSDLFTQLRFVV